MRHLQPVDLVIDFDVPESGFFADESMDGPVWDTASMTQTFFGRIDRFWFQQIERTPIYLDGERIVIPRSATSDHRIWRLVDVERLAHALATQGRLVPEQLVRVLEVVRAVGEQWGYLPARELPLRLEDHDPDRKDLYAVTTEDTRTDDLDSTEGAFPRSFALGEVVYHLDLTDEHWNDLLAAMAPYVKVARRSSRGAAAKKARQVDRAKVRAWARRQGFTIGARGRIPQAVMDAYLRKTR